MLRFLYENEYDDARPTMQLKGSGIYASAASLNSDSPGMFTPDFNQREKAMSANVRVYIIADKYNIPPLKKYARMKYGEIMDGVLRALKSMTYHQQDVLFDCSVRCTTSAITTVAAAAKSEAGEKGEVMVKGEV